MRSANCIAPQGIVVGRKRCDASLHARTTVKKPITGVACCRARRERPRRSHEPRDNSRRRISDLPRLINSLSQSGLHV